MTRVLFTSILNVRVGAIKSAPLIELCVDEAGSKSPIQCIDIGNYTVSCLPFTINCQEPKLGSLVVRCSFYEDFLEYHDVRVVLDFI